MTKKVRIKDVAKLAGVSSGTVDRVIHNRGNVSKAKKEKVEKALRQLNYNSNIHVSSISLKRTYNVIITIPQYNPGDYWERTSKGIEAAIQKFSRLKIAFDYVYYNQFDLYSCRDAFESIVIKNPDAVIIGPTFRDEAVHLANTLADRGIPYVFVDSAIADTSPLAFFITNPFSAGYLMARLITGIVPANSDIAIMQAVRNGDESANTTIIRKAGFIQYCRDNDLQIKLPRVQYSVMQPEENEKLIGRFFQENQQVKGAVVFNSRAHIIADYFKKHNISGVKLIGIDVLHQNIKFMEEGLIEFLIGQRPEQQGYLAMKTLFEHLVITKPVRTENYMPIDIITKENLKIYVEFNSFEYED